MMTRMTKYFSLNRLPRSFQIKLRKQQSQIILGTFVVSTMSLFTVAMVIQIQDIENRGNVYNPDRIISQMGDDFKHQLPPFPGKHRNLVARETLAVGDDYQDLTVNNKKADQKVSVGAKTFQGGFKSQEKSPADESQWNASPLSNGAVDTIKSSGKSFSHPGQPFYKIADANGRVMFEIKNSKYREKGKKSVKFYHQAEQPVRKEGKLHHAEEVSYYAYDYDRDSKENLVLNHEELKLDQELGLKKFKFLLPNKNLKDFTSEDDPISQRKNHSNGRIFHEGNKEPHLAHVQSEENWPNSHQMKGGNNDSKKTGQFVLSAGAQGSVKNINSSNGKHAEVSPSNNQGRNLLQGIMGNDHRAVVGRTQPCVKGGTCQETDTDTNEETGPRTSKMDHHYPSDKLSGRSDGFFEKQPAAFQEGESQRKELNPAAVGYLSNNGKIETQIPIQEGPALVPVEYPATQLQYPNSLRRNISLQSEQGMPLIVDRIYWSKEALALVPAGISEKEFQDFLKATSSEKVTVMEKATWLRCGRPKNQFIQLESGIHLCARYRDHFKMIQGDILSFYLSRFLGLDNIPPVALARVDSNVSQWESVKSEIVQAGWSQNHIINQIMWIDSIGRQSHIKMPQLILKTYEANQTLTWRDQSLRALSASYISDLIQWSDLVLFDYITGNYDRVASMQDGAEVEKRPEIMHENMRNLPKDRNGKLWLIDNECGLLDAYNLIKYSHQKFHRFHRQMLQTLCIFNEKTVSKISILAKFPEPHKLLVSYAEDQDPLYKLFPEDYHEFTLFKHLFHTRLKDITAWTEYCKTL